MSRRRTSVGHIQILFYYPGDANWWLGTNNVGTRHRVLAG